MPKIFIYFPHLPSKRFLSTDRIWSSNKQAGRTLNIISGLQPKACPLLVNGAMMTLGKAEFKSLGDTVRAGRVF